jgi:hypothetical protein
MLSLWISKHKTSMFGLLAKSRMKPDLCVYVFLKEVVDQHMSFMCLCLEIEASLERLSWLVNGFAPMLSSGFESYKKLQKKFFCECTGLGVDGLIKN